MTTNKTFKLSNSLAILPFEQRLAGCHECFQFFARSQFQTYSAKGNCFDVHSTFDYVRAYVKVFGVFPKETAFDVILGQKYYNDFSYTLEEFVKDIESGDYGTIMSRIHLGEVVSSKVDPSCSSTVEEDEDEDEDEEELDDNDDYDEDNHQQDDLIVEVHPHIIHVDKPFGMGFIMDSYFIKIEDKIITLYYNEGSENVEKLFAHLKAKVVLAINRIVRHAYVCKFGILSQDCGSFDIIWNKTKDVQVDLDLNYGAGFTEKAETFIEYLNDTEASPGLVLFHGIPGTGKTTFIRWLINKQKNNNLIIVPKDIMEQLVNPAFLNKAIDILRNKVILVEDAESLLRSREEGENTAISNLLNLTDGLYGDLFNIKVICTFNTLRANIDSALTRQGRLKHEHHFGALNVEDSNTKLKALGKTFIATEPMTLAAIYGAE